MNLEMPHLREICFWTFVICCSQLPAASPGDVQDETKQIDKIEASSRENEERPRTIRLITGTDHGGELLCYAQIKEIHRIRVVIGLSNHGLTHEYFFEKGVLRLAIVRRDFYPWNPELNALDRTKISRSTEDRYYFNRGALTYWITKRQKASGPTQMSFEEMEKIVVKDAVVFLEIAKNRADTADIESFLKAP